MKLIKCRELKDYNKTKSEQLGDLEKKTWPKIILKMTLHDLEFIRSLGLNDFDKVKVNCNKFEVSIFIIAFKLFRKIVSESVSG